MREAREARPTPSDQRLKLYCFPHAGAGVSSFQRWPRAIGPVAEVVPGLLPGRDSRRREPRVTTPRALVDDVLATLGPPPEAPYILYGHSLGGLVAYTLTRALHEFGLPLPSLVAVGAGPPPDSTVTALERDGLPDEELVRLLGGFGSDPPPYAEPGGLWYRLILPVLRADIRLARALREAADKPLDTPLLVLSGRDDSLVTPETMTGWRRWTTGPVIERTLPGDHFFVRDPALPALLRRACHVVRRLTDRHPGSDGTSEEAGSWVRNKENTRCTAAP